MTVIESVLPFVGILLGLIILHELGHFVVAKMAGVRVEEFGIGMPPRIGGIRFGETLYSINWLPLGGFVRLTGEESARVFVTQINRFGPADRAGLRSNDVILEVNGVPVHSQEQLAQNLGIALLDDESEGPIELLVDREIAGDRGPTLERQTLTLEPPPGSEIDSISSRKAAAAISHIAGIQVGPDPRSLATKPRPVRIAVMAAGAGVNFVLPIILFAIAVMIPQPVAEGPAIITSVVGGGPADQAGLQPRDEVISVNGDPIRNASDLSLAIQLNVGEGISVVVERDVVQETATQRASTERERFETIVRARLAPDQLEHVVQPGETVHDVAEILGVSASQVLAGAGFTNGIPLEPGVELLLPDGQRYLTQPDDTAESVARDLGIRSTVVLDAAGIDPLHLAPGTLVTIPQGPTGITITNLRRTTVNASEGFFSAVGSGWDRTMDTLILMRNRIRSWIAGGEPLQLSGPIGIAQTTGEVVREVGWLRLIELAALLSINLAIINILPLPMLDGGRIMFVLLEILRGGRRISPEKEGLVHLAGFVLILMFVVIVSYFDILRVVDGESTLR